MFWLIVVIVLLCLLLYYYTIKKFNYWKDKGVVQKAPKSPIKDFVEGILQKQSFADLVKGLYREFPGKRYAGVYPVNIATFMLRDPDLIKQIGIKDFDHFTDHQSFMPEGNDPLWSGNLFSLKGDKWRHMRTTLSPAFTSSKMKAMFYLMTECAETFVQHFSKNDSKIITVDVTDVLTRYTNDVIATTAFGIKCNSLENRENEFYMMGKEVSGIFKGFWQNFKIIINVLIPSIGKLLGLKLFKKSTSKFFLNLVQTTIKTREEHNIVRPDMINILMEARKGKIKQDKHDVVKSNSDDTGFAIVEEHLAASGETLQNLSDLDVTAQALIFFLGGFDTVSRSMCFAAHELATNPDVQEKLLAEIDEVYENCNGKVTYDALTKMKYMDMVISETLRKWPNLIVVDRQCVQPYTIAANDANEKPVTLDVGDVCWIPIIALHYDPEYYPEPDRFDPERFSDENKSKINPYTYLPFGVGPRNCIGSRFALLEMKVVFFYILSKFELVPVEKTEIPLKLNKRDFNLTPLNGFWLGFKKRKILS